MPWVSFSFEGGLDFQTRCFGENGFNSTSANRQSAIGFDPERYSLSSGKNGKKNDFVIFSDGLPQDCARNSYAELVAALNGKGVMTILDTHGEALARGLPPRLSASRSTWTNLSILRGNGRGLRVISKCTWLPCMPEGSPGVITMGGDGACSRTWEQFLFARTGTR
jgi:hypothetical protein